jgi:hypothetical protein
MVDQLLEKTGALELQQRRIERLNRTLEVLSAVNALIVRAATARRCSTRPAASRWRRAASVSPRSG